MKLPASNKFLILCLIFLFCLPAWSIQTTGKKKQSTTTEKKQTKKTTKKSTSQKETTAKGSAKKTKAKETYSGKDQSALKSRQKKIRDSINFINSLLKETKTIKNRSMGELLTLNKKIEMREGLIYTINSEIGSIDHQISLGFDSVSVYRGQVGKLKDEYRKLAVYAYKNRNDYDKLLFVMSAVDLQQAYRRLKYIREINESRERKAKMILDKQNEIEKKISELEAKKNSKKSLLSTEEKERMNLTAEKSEKEQLFSELREKEAQLKSDLDKKKKDAEKIDAMIKDLIRKELERQKEEARKAAEKAKAKNPTKPGTEKTNPDRRPELTKEAKELSAGFANNRGKLPWPVIQGYVTERYGVHDHPTIKGVKISNSGVNIGTGKGSLARAVFEGEVTSIATIPDLGKLIIVRHGEYLSVYANLEEVYVQIGEKIKTKQNIGKVRFSPDDARAELHLEIWKGQNNQDPLLWLFKN